MNHHVVEINLKKRKKITLNYLRNDKNELQKLRNWMKSDINSTLNDFDFERSELTMGDDPVKHFELFFDDELFTILADMTMNYAKSKGEHKLLVNADDMHMFIALSVLSGYVSVPIWRMFWQK